MGLQCLLEGGDTRTVLDPKSSLIRLAERGKLVPGIIITIVILYIGFDANKESHTKKGVGL